MKSCGSGYSISSEYGSGSRVWLTKSWTKKIQLKYFLYLFYIKNCYLLMSKLQEKPSALKREHPALQKLNLLIFFMFVGLFCPPVSGAGCILRIRIRIQVPQWIRNLSVSGSGSTTLIQLESKRTSRPRGWGVARLLAWPGWKQNEISVKVDYHDSKEADSRKVVYYCTSLLLNSRVLLHYRIP